MCICYNSIIVWQFSPLLVLKKIPLKTKNISLEYPIWSLLFQQIICLFFIISLIVSQKKKTTQHLMYSHKLCIFTGKICTGFSIFFLFFLLTQFINTVQSKPTTVKHKNVQINNTTEQNHFIYHCWYSRFVIIQMYNACAYGLDVKCWARDVNGRTSQIATNCKSEIQTSMHPSICALRTIFVCANLWALRTATRIDRTSHWMGGGCCFSEYWFVNNSPCTLNNCLNEHDGDELIGQKYKIQTSAMEEHIHS